MMDQFAVSQTEDETKSAKAVALDKKEIQQKRLLSIQARLPGGNVGNVFSLNVCNSADNWYCNLCQCTVRGNVYNHENGKRHTSNMQVVGTTYIESEPKTQTSSSPQEEPAAIQKRIDAYTFGPLIGLEYLFELIDDSKKTQYVCLLCDKRGDSYIIIQHVASCNHIIKYMQRHFLTCYRIIAPRKHNKSNYQETVKRIGKAIERKFGRLHPHVVSKTKFEQNHSHYVNLVSHGQHFSEESGITFKEMVDLKDLTKPVQAFVEDHIVLKSYEDEYVRRMQNKAISKQNVATITRKRKSLPVNIKTKRQKQSISTNEEQKPKSSLSSTCSSDSSDSETSKHSSRTEDYRSSTSTKRDHSPYKRGIQRSHSQKSVSPMEYSKQMNEKWEQFKKLSTAIDNDMNHELKGQEKNPEKHPKYNEEWKTFWSKRCRELKAEGKDPQAHNFQAEWIVFWKRRLVELHSLEVKARKDALRKRLGMAEESICLKIKEEKEDSHDSDVILIDDEDVKNPKRCQSPWEYEDNRHTVQLSKETSRTKSHERNSFNPYSKNKDQILQQYSKDKCYREFYRRTDLSVYNKSPHVVRSPIHSPSNIHHELVEPVDERNINIVGMLRLLTALEEKLGSLGPKVNNLLTRALAMEKAEPNSSESLLDQETNCALFETVKEKLKGHLIIGVVEYTQEKIFKNAIRKIAGLMHFVNVRKQHKQKEKPPTDSIKLPGVGTIDKANIAEYIANALVLQGKTDVSQDDLEQLINVVIKMAKASCNSNKPITTAEFIQQLSQSKSTENKSDSSDDNEKESLQSARSRIIANNAKKSFYADLRTASSRISANNAKDLPYADMQSASSSISANNMENLSSADLQSTSSRISANNVENLSSAALQPASCTISANSVKNLSSADLQFTSSRILANNAKTLPYADLLSSSDDLQSVDSRNSARNVEHPSSADLQFSSSRILANNAKKLPYTNLKSTSSRILARNIDSLPSADLQSASSGISVNNVKNLSYDLQSANSKITANNVENLPATDLQSAIPGISANNAKSLPYGDLQSTSSRISANNTKNLPYDGLQSTSSRISANNANNSPYADLQSASSRSSARSIENLSSVDLQSAGVRTSANNAKRLPYADLWSASSRSLARNMENAAGVRISANNAKRFPYADLQSASSRSSARNVENVSSIDLQSVDSRISLNNAKRLPYNDFQSASSRVTVNNGENLSAANLQSTSSRISANNANNSPYADLQSASSRSSAKKMENLSSADLHAASSSISASNAKNVSSDDLQSVSSKISSNNMENLSYADLQTRLQNFNDLPIDEQHGLISHLKKLEAQEPEKVEHLRKFVNLDDGSDSVTTVLIQTEKNINDGRKSPFSNRIAGINPSAEENTEVVQSEEYNKPVVPFLDSEDEDYSYEDIFLNVKQTLEEKEKKECHNSKNATFRAEDFDLSNAKSVIASGMGQFRNTDSESSSVTNLLGLGVVNTQKSDLVITPSTIRNLDNFPFDITSLTKAIQSVQKYKPDLKRNTQDSTNIGQHIMPLGNYSNQSIPNHDDILQAQRLQNDTLYNTSSYSQTVSSDQQFDVSRFGQYHCPTFNSNNCDENMNSDMFYDGSQVNSTQNNYNNRWYSQ